MEAYKSIRMNRELKLSEVLILVAIISMYSGLILTVLGQIFK
jgi:hypothetical protein